MRRATAAAGRFGLTLLQELDTQEKAVSAMEDLLE
jgi:hypothetical protein